MFQVATGILTCSKQTQKPEGIILEDLFSCRITVENGSHNYTSLDRGIPTLLFNSIKDKIEIMIKSYHDGLTLSDYSLFWVKDGSYNDTSNHQ